MKCNLCNGTGEIMVPYDPSPPGVALSPGTIDIEEDCPDCGGSGEIPDRWTDEQLHEAERWFNKASDQVKGWLIKNINGYECGLCHQQLNMLTKQYWKLHMEKEHPLGVSVTRSVNVGTQSIQQLKYERRKIYDEPPISD